MSAAFVLEREGVHGGVESSQVVFFDVTRRVDVSLLGWWQRWLYVVLCRKLPARWRVPPVPPMRRGGFATFAAADAACTSVDDQLSVFPWGAAYSGDELDTEIVCRPRDKSDAANQRQYEKLREKYQDYDADEYLTISRAEYKELVEAREKVQEAVRRMQLGR